MRGAQGSVLSGPPPRHGKTGGGRRGSGDTGLGSRFHFWGLVSLNGFLLNSFNINVYLFLLGWTAGTLDSHHFLPVATQPSRSGQAGDCWDTGTLTLPLPPRWPRPHEGQAVSCGQGTAAWEEEGSLETPGGHLPPGLSQGGFSRSWLRSRWFSGPIPPSQRDKRKECLRADFLGEGGGKESGEGRGRYWRSSVESRFQLASHTTLPRTRLGLLGASVSPSLTKGTIRVIWFMWTWDTG